MTWYLQFTVTMVAFECGKESIKSTSTWSVRKLHNSILSFDLVRSNTCNTLRQSKGLWPVNPHGISVVKSCRTKWRFLLTFWSGSVLKHGARVKSRTSSSLEETQDDENSHGSLACCINIMKHLWVYTICTLSLPVFSKFQTIEWFLWHWASFSSNPSLKHGSTNVNRNRLSLQQILWKQYELLTAFLLREWSKENALAKL